MPQFRINIKGAPKHLQKAWSDKLSRLFTRHMEERDKLRVAQLKLQRQKILQGIQGG
jgi:hypothetical protein